MDMFSLLKSHTFGLHKQKSSYLSYINFISLLLGRVKLAFRPLLIFVQLSQEIKPKRGARFNKKKSPDKQFQTKNLLTSYLRQKNSIPCFIFYSFFPLITLIHQVPTWILLQHTGHKSSSENGFYGYFQQIGKTII